MRFIVVVLVKVDLLNSCHLLGGAVPVEQQFTKINCPHRGGIEPAGQVTCVSDSVGVFIINTKV